MNNGSWLSEEDFKGLSDDFKGLSDDFFDDLINQIDFPLEDIETDTPNGEGDWEARFQELEPPPMDLFSTLPSEFTSVGIIKGGRVGVHKTIPILKQSNSSEAFSGTNSSLHKSSLPPDIKVSKLFQSPSPVSVFENSYGSLSSQNSRSQRLSFPVKGMRSKRKRPTTLKFRNLLPFEPRKPEKLTPLESESESYYSSKLFGKRKRKKHKTHQTHTMSSSSSPTSSDGISQKCTHCETTKTPQWREGPNGPKTLCNACGVRFRSGRLVPEYRPASSPTFIPSVHSNSHRKIVEMRRKGGDQFDTGMIHAVISRA